MDCMQAVPPRSRPLTYDAIVMTFVPHLPDELSTEPTYNWKDLGCQLLYFGPTLFDSRSRVWRIMIVHLPVSLRGRPEADLPRLGQPTATLKPRCTAASPWWESSVSDICAKNRLQSIRLSVAGFECHPTATQSFRYKGGSRYKLQVSTAVQVGFICRSPDQRYLRHSAMLGLISAVGTTTYENYRICSEIVPFPRQTSHVTRNPSALRCSRKARRTTGRWAPSRCNPQCITAYTTISENYNDYPDTNTRRVQPTTLISYHINTPCHEHTMSTPLRLTDSLRCRSMGSRRRQSCHMWERIRGLTPPSQLQVWGGQQAIIGGTHTSPLMAHCAFCAAASSGRAAALAPAMRASKAVTVLKEKRIVDAVDECWWW
ncbi:hypothetical protein LshimejAT787_0700160 [Lyophyllum shimeji]|uniref:Uncharacterized protein n=1 Tax=Lyophyllum shimeji TaxID=47721 RepID=A0A9P3UQR6_LYOSH|nr:hypothetical protein LshimejAT787_0700160 [Lyophyllum shimeji]